MKIEDIARVDAWLLQHGITPGTDTRIRRLVRVWNMLQNAWPQDDATEAAMLGTYGTLGAALVAALEDAGEEKIGLNYGH